ncbi:hypothetical protein [Clostridium sp. KNHs214]|uniref:hypothetical protein n=1 Tax=Clostridium sp. KNHs214 TaxID=1540257 RepID=UPI00163A3E91|nr:hypothetical protein [Clostridium sp. KNHs214]
MKFENIRISWRIANSLKNIFIVDLKTDFSYGTCFTIYAFDDARACDIFVKYDNYKNERNLQPNRVGANYFWLVDDEKDFFIGVKILFI